MEKDEYGLKVPETRYEKNGYGVDVPTQRYKKYLKKRREKEDGLAPMTEEEKAQGFRNGKQEELPQAEEYAYESDGAIPEDDSYYKQGCQRRMVFVSDPVPAKMQYIVVQSGQQFEPEDLNFSNALTKFFDWCRTRPKSNDKGTDKWDEAAYLDSKLPRHFILKMGPPNGPYGDANWLGERLDSAVKEYLRTRLQKSHVTIETEIPYTQIASTPYFKKYMDTILGLTDKKKLGNRLTIKLAHVPTEQLLHADPKLFYAKDIDIEAEWQHKVQDLVNANVFILTLLNKRGTELEDMCGYARAPDDREVATAKDIFWRQMKDQMERNKIDVGTALEDTKAFIKAIHNFEQTKESASTAIKEVIDLTSDTTAHIAPLSEYPSRAFGTAQTSVSSAQQRLQASTYVPAFRPSRYTLPRPQGFVDQPQQPVSRSQDPDSAQWIPQHQAQTQDYPYHQQQSSYTQPQTPVQASAYTVHSIQTTQQQQEHVSPMTLSSMTGDNAKPWWSGIMSPLASAPPQMPQLPAGSTFPSQSRYTSPSIVTQIPQQAQSQHLSSTAVGHTSQPLQVPTLAPMHPLFATQGKRKHNGDGGEEREDSEKRNKTLRDQNT